MTPSRPRRTPVRLLVLAALALGTSACEPEDLSGTWQLSAPPSEQEVGRLRIQHWPTGAANASDRIRLDAELRGQRLAMEGAFWHGGTFAVLARGCSDETATCTDSVNLVLGHRGGEGREIGSRFPAELVILPDTVRPGSNPIFLLLESPSAALYEARQVRGR